MNISCGGCAACCKEVIAVVTDADIRRICKHTGLEPLKFIKLYSPSQLELPPHQDGWIKMKEGRRMFGLKQPKGKCIFLGKRNRCTIYEARPMICRTFPFVLYFNSKGEVISIDSHKNANDGGAGCEAVLKLNHPEKKLEQDTKQESKEDLAFWKKIKLWNTGQRKRTQEELLLFLKT